MKTIVILVVFTIIIIGIIFLPRRKDKDSDYKEEKYKPSGKKWVFNGLLHIDNPPEDPSVFTQYEGEIKLITKKGFVQYEITLPKSVNDEALGMYYVEVLAKDGYLSIQKDRKEIARISSPQPKLSASVAERGGVVPAYCFVARRPDTGDYYGAVCVSR